MTTTFCNFNCFINSCSVQEFDLNKPFDIRDRSKQHYEPRLQLLLFLKMALNNNLVSSVFELFHISFQLINQYLFRQLYFFQSYYLKVSCCMHGFFQLATKTSIAISRTFCSCHYSPNFVPISDFAPT